jgi:two-component system nitrogen regulation response regulator GlnG
LLRVLAEGEFYRVGGRELIRADARVIAATHQDLERKVADGSFRADLLHRLDVVRIALPPLRERRDDITALATRFLTRACSRLGIEPKRFADAALAALRAYDWPGNVRELENVCARLALMAPGREILPADVRTPTAATPAATSWTDALRVWALAALAAGDEQIHATAKRELDRVLLEVALAQTQGHRQHAAQRLGLGRNTITRKLGARRRRKSSEK